MISFPASRAIAARPLHAPADFRLPGLRLKGGKAPATPPPPAIPGAKPANRGVLPGMWTATIPLRYKNCVQAAVFNAKRVFSAISGIFCLTGVK